MRKRVLTPYVPWCSAKGFTLVELVTVIVLLGIVSVYAMPRLVDLDIFRERGFFDETQSALRYAQKLAVASGCAVQVTIAAGGYSLNQGNPGCLDTTYTLAVPHPSSGQPFAGTAPSGVALAPATNVVFNALGQASSCLPAASQDFTVGTQILRLWCESGYVERL